MTEEESSCWSTLFLLLSILALLYIYATLPLTCSNLVLTLCRTHWHQWCSMMQPDDPVFLSHHLPANVYKLRVHCWTEGDTDEVDINCFFKQNVEGNVIPCTVKPNVQLLLLMTEVVCWIMDFPLGPWEFLMSLMMSKHQYLCFKACCFFVSAMCHFVSHLFCWFVEEQQFQDAFSE